MSYENNAGRVFFFVQEPTSLIDDKIDTGYLVVDLLTTIKKHDAKTIKLSRVLAGCKVLPHFGVYKMAGSRGLFGPFLVSARVPV